MNKQNEEKAKEIVENNLTFDYLHDVCCDREDMMKVALEMADWKEQQMIEKAVEWIDYNNRNGGCLFDGWKEDFKKAMEE